MDKPATHPAIPTPRIGVLLVNLGTPDAAEPGAVRRYLKQFLSDRRVVEIPPLVWQPILRGAVLTTRPKKSAEAYAKVWTERGSPLAWYTARQAELLQLRLGADVQVEYGMRYGNPDMGRRLQAMKDNGCGRILVAPLYPQYCGASTATANDAAFDALKAMRWQPAIRTLPAYHDDAGYIDALARSVESALSRLDFAPEVLMASFHGMPERTLELGDPYHCQCRKTARLLSERMGREIVTSFQSRFGRAKWLEPATDTTLKALAAKGVKRLAIFAPGFSSDCLETLEELAIQGREQFTDSGGEHFAYLPCLNDGDLGMDLIETLVRRELAGWV